MNFLKNGPAAVENIRKNTPLKLFWAKGYSDYHPENPGGDPLGRTVEARPFNINSLGKKEVSRLRRAPMAAPIPMPVTGYGYKWMNLMFSKPFKAFPIIFKSMFQGIGGLLIGKRMSAGGEALAAGLFAGTSKKDIPVWTNTEFKEFVMEGDRITGVIAEQNGKEVTLKARKGVILAAGGFDHNLPKNSPGADDNASSVAALLEIAHIISKQPEPSYGVNLVPFSLEEPLIFKTKNMGSYIHAKSVFEKELDIIGMLSLEMIGYYWPEDEQLRQNKNFLIVSGKRQFNNFNKTISHLIRTQNLIDSRYVSYADHLKINGPSDNRNYWIDNYPAAMIIGSGKGGNPHYHQLTDTIETLDFEVLAKATSRIMFAVINFEV